MSATAAVAALVSASAQGAADPNGEQLIRVARGDTLIGLARQYLDPAQDWRGLQRLNRVADPRRLQPGRELRLPVAWLKAQPALAEAVHVLGQVTVERSGSAGQPSAVTVGDRLQGGDLVRAGPASSVTLRFADGASVLLRPESSLRLTRLLQRPTAGTADTGLQLDQGSAESRVPAPEAPTSAGPRRYDITTPTVHLGVRGTEFRTRVDAAAATTHVEVIEGVVTAGAGRGAQPLGAGQGAVATAGTRTLVPAPLLPAPDLSGLPSRLERVPLRLAWSLRDGVAAWRAQVLEADQPGQPDRLLLDGRFDTAAARWPDLPDGSYQLRVRAMGATGLEGLDARHAFVLKARPFPPFTSQPRAGASLRGDRVRFAWAEADGLSGYRLQLAALPPEAAAAAASFASPLVDRLVSAAEHEEALPPGRYAWRMASVRGGADQGPFGDPQSFALRPLPPAPALQEPQLRDDTLVLRWPAGEPGDRYELQLAEEPSFQSPLHTLQTSEPEATLPRPGPGRYHVRVRTLDADGTAGPYGAAQKIEVPHSRWWWLLPAGLILLAL